MSKKIPTIGKVWLIFLAVLATVGIVTNILGISSNGIVYLISAIACAGELVGVIFMLQGKGLPYFILYGASYIVNVILAAILSTGVSVSWFIGFIIGVGINIGLTYLAVKNTLDLKKGE